jgi:hypothetical protein
LPRKAISGGRLDEREEETRCQNHVNFSPDGKWWWDGQRWQPVEQAPQPAPRPPGPPPSKRRKRWPWVLGGVVVLLVLFSVCIAAIANSSGGQQKATATATPAVAAATPKAATTAAKASAAPTRNGSCAPQPCANDNYGWIATVSDVKYDAPSGSDFEKPESGNVYVTMNVTFTNQLTTEQHANPTEFVLQDGAGIKHTIGFMTACPIWQPVNVTAGATFGPKCMVFEATAGKPTGLVLVWTPSGFGGGYQMKLS